MFMSVFVMCCLCKRPLRRADHLFGGVLPGVVCLTVCDAQTSTLKWPKARAGLLRVVTGPKLWLDFYVCYLRMLSAAEVINRGDDE